MSAGAQPGGRRSLPGCLPAGAPAGTWGRGPRLLCRHPHSCPPTCSIEVQQVRHAAQHALLQARAAPARVPASQVGQARPGALNARRRLGCSIPASGASGSSADATKAASCLQRCQPHPAPEPKVVQAAVEQRVRPPAIHAPVKGCCYELLAAPAAAGGAARAASAHCRRSQGTAAALQAAGLGSTASLPLAMSPCSHPQPPT